MEKRNWDFVIRSWRSICIIKSGNCDKCFLKHQCVNLQNALYRMEDRLKQGETDS